MVDFGLDLDVFIAIVNDCDDFNFVKFIVRGKATTASATACLAASPAATPDSVARTATVSALTYFSLPDPF